MAGPHGGRQDVIELVSRGEQRELGTAPGVEGAGRVPSQPFSAGPVATGPDSGARGQGSRDMGHGDASSGSSLGGMASQHGAASGGWGAHGACRAGPPGVSAVGTIANSEQSGGGTEGT